MSPVLRKIVLILIVILVVIAILTELVFQTEIGIENLLRLVVIITAVVVVGVMFLSPRPKPFRIQDLVRKPKPSGPLFTLGGDRNKKTKDDQDPTKHKQFLFRLPSTVYRRPTVGPARKETLFGTAGIRGLTNIEITPLTTLKISQVYGDYLGNRGTVATGYDTRYGAEILAQSASAGLRSAGINVINCGCIPTGGLSCFIVRNKLAGGILITGSHMAYNRIGIIIVMPDGSYIPAEVARDLEERFAEYEGRSVKILPEAMGQSETASQPLADYEDFLLTRVDKDVIGRKQYNVLIDPANGTGGLVLPGLLTKLNCNIHLINGEIKPVPGRSPEPRAENLKTTAEKVTQVGCQLGVALDIDADRVLFIDEKGVVISEDVMGAIFARAVLKSHGPTDQPKTCVTPINSSGLIEHVCTDLGLKLEYCPVGQPATVKVVKNLKADFSYEESGKYYFASEALWADGILATLKLLEIMAKENKSLSELAAQFPPFYQVKHTVPCEQNRHEKTMQKVFEIWQKQALAGKVRDITVDGLKRVYEDKSWLLIRASGTEPLIRVYADATSLARAEELVKWGEEIVRSAITS